MRCSLQAKRSEYARHYKATGQPARVADARMVIPADIEVLAAHSPCFNCESRGPCRHRPWMLAS